MLGSICLLGDVSRHRGRVCSATDGDRFPRWCCVPRRTVHDLLTGCYRESSGQDCGGAQRLTGRLQLRPVGDERECSLA